MRIVYTPTTGYIEKVSANNIKEPSCEAIRCRYLTPEGCANNNCLIVPNNNYIVHNARKYYVNLKTKELKQRTPIHIRPGTSDLIYVISKASEYGYFIKYNYTNSEVSSITFNVQILDQVSNLLSLNGLYLSFKTKRGTLNQTEGYTENGTITFVWTPPSYWEKNTIHIFFPLDNVNNIKYYSAGTRIRIYNES